MAIQVSGTTVIDGSRNLVNVIGLKTVNSTSLLGSGDIAAGASTTFDAVGTYAWGRPQNSVTTYNQDDTASGMYITKQNANGHPHYTYDWQNCTAVAMSGTWRCMSMAYGTGSPTGNGFMGLWVRIS
jgi:hypothetical protein